MNYRRLIISLALPQLAGFIGSFFTVPAVSTWYASLQKPAFSPSNWIFGPVWIALYFLMGISVYLIWQKKGPMLLFWVHLFFNALWSVIFFGLKNPGLALINLVILWFLIIILIIRFWKASLGAALLLIPYLIWVSFAGYLNYSFWSLNRCQMDAKLCPDGSYASRIPPECEFACSVSLFYYNPENDKDEDGNIKCSQDGLVPVGRKTSTIEETINLLLRGELTEEEINQGITTEYPLEEFRLIKTDLQNGHLTLTFDDPLFKSSGGACRARVLWHQIEATAKQFFEVQEVSFLPLEVFQP